MSLSWNFPARTEVGSFRAEPSGAELGHFIFQAETELNQIFLFQFFPKFLSPEVLYHVISINFVIIYLKFCFFKGENFDSDA